jgi:hypothetical protein
MKRRRLGHAEGRNYTLAVTPSESPRDRSIRNMPWWARVCDALLVAILALTAYVKVFGGFRFELGGAGGLRVTVGSPIKLLGEFAILALARHWLYRPVSTRVHLTAIAYRLYRLTAVIRDRTSRWPGEVWTVATTAVATRLSVIFIGILAVHAIGFPPDAANVWRASADELSNLPARWDAGWYLSIASEGYQWNAANHGQQNLVFFPAFPMLTRGVAYLIWWRDPTPAVFLWAGVLVSVLAFVAALIYLYYLARDRIGEDNTTLAITLLAAYPFAVFYSAAYTEAFFLLAAVATFYHFLHGQLWRAAGWGLLTGLTRPNGWMVSASLILIALPSLGGSAAALARILPRADRPRTPVALPRRRPLALLVASSAPVVGLLIYCGYNFWLTGYLFTFARLMTYWNRNFHGLSLLAGTLDAITSAGIVSHIAAHPIDILNELSLLFGLVTIWPVTRRLGLAYGLFVLLNLALPATSGGLESIGRYTSVLFPSFMWLAMASPKAARPAIVAVFALGQGLAAVLFFTWRGMY